MEPQNLQLLDVQAFGLDISTVGTVALIVIMITMGLNLEPRDFRKVIAEPRAALTGLAAQLVLLPAMGFFLAWLLSPPMPIAVGLIILACCPSGATSNFFSFLARGDVALSVVLTAVSGVVVVFTAPLLIELALRLFTGEGQEIHLPIAASMLRIFNLVVLPVVAGMAFRRLAPRIAVAVQPWATRVSFAVVLFTMAVLLEYGAQDFGTMFAMAWPVTVSLNVVMMAVGFFGARRLAISERQSRSISIEIGIQNYILSVVIALALLQRPDFAIVPVIYLFTMYVTVFSFIAWSRYVRDRNPSTSVLSDAAAAAGTAPD